MGSQKKREPRLADRAVKGTVFSTVAKQHPITTQEKPLMFFDVSQVDDAYRTEKKMQTACCSARISHLCVVPKDKI